MSRSFSSIGLFVRFMSQRVTTLPAAQKRALDAASQVVLEEARCLPGTYQAGWPALDPETIAHKATGDSPLVETGGMRTSYGRKVVSAMKAAVGSNDPRAMWQELGTARGVPPRPVLKAAAIRKEGEVHRIIGHHLVAHIAGRSNR